MAKCKGCGKEIIWATSKETGKKIPLDPRPPVYVYAETPEGEMQCWRPLAPSAVTHFATCPKANDFSASRGPDWKKILKAYRDHVIDEESIDFLGPRRDPRKGIRGLTPDEFAHLMRAVGYTDEEKRDG